MPVLARAGRLLEARGQASLPPGITPHSLRHTFASLFFAIGEDPVSVMRDLGHPDPAFTLRVYAHSMVGGPDERERLRELPTATRWSARRLGSSNVTVLIPSAEPNGWHPHSNRNPIR